MAPRVGPPELLLRARRREGPGPAERRRRAADRGDGDRRGGGDPGPELRADPVLPGLLDVRLPASLSRSRAVNRSRLRARERHPTVFGDRPARVVRDFPWVALGIEEDG